ncbi:MAG: GAF domain-containing protein [Caldilineaceae bacterium]|nr:GAF domain-containing protein [Caldilineaceae bacterium]
MCSESIDAESASQPFTQPQKPDELTAIFNRILCDLESFIEYKAASVFQEEDGHLRVIAIRHHTTLGVGFTYPIAEMPLYQEIVRTKKPVVLQDVHDEPRFRYFSLQLVIHGWMAIPLIVNRMVQGVITFVSDRVGAFSEQDARLAQTFINQAAHTIEKTEMAHTLSVEKRNLEMLYQILRQLNTTSSVAEILPAIGEGLHKLTDCDAIELAIFEEDDQSVTVARHSLSETEEAALSHTRYSQVESAATATLLAGQIHHTRDLQQEQAFGVEATYVSEGYQERIIWPLALTKRIRGSIQLLWRSSLPQRIDNLGGFAQVVDVIAMAVEKNLLFTQTQRRIQEKDNLNHFTLALRPLGTSVEIIKAALEHILFTFQGSSARFCAPASQPGFLEMVAEVGQPLSRWDRERYGEDSIFGHVYATGQPYLSGIGLLESLMRTPADLWRDTPYQLVSALYAPVHIGTQVTGVIGLYYVGTNSQYTRDDLKLLTTMAEIIGTALHRCSLMETMEQRVRSRTQELAEANERLKELDRLKSDFVANVSHELRTPLTNIRFYVDLLQRGRSEKREQYLAILESEILRLNTLIEAILDLSRLNQAREQEIFEVTAFDIGQLLTEVYQNYLLQAVNKGISLSYQPPSQPLTLSANRNQIIQVVTNLLSNAINYTLNGGSVTLSVHPAQNDGIEISIQDTGIGIDSADLKHLFERFYRSTHVTNMGIPGTGLGLSIVKEIVDLHRGEIRANSKKGFGSTFTIWLPDSTART